MPFKSIFYVLIALPLTILAQGTSKTPRVVRASAEATVTAKPDRARILIGVITQAPSAETASAQNAAQSTQVVESMKQIIRGKGEVRTTGYSVSPEYATGHQDSPKISGYRANNTVMVTIDDLSIVGSVIDTASQSGANEVTGISFLLRDDGAVRAQALAQAAEKARTNAEAIAKALGLQVVGVLSAESTESGEIRPTNMSMVQSIGRSRVSTPIETGTLDVSAHVTITLEIQ